MDNEDEDKFVLEFYNISKKSDLISSSSEAKDKIKENDSQHSPPSAIGMILKSNAINIDSPPNDIKEKKLTFDTHDDDSSSDKCSNFSTSPVSPPDLDDPWKLVNQTRICNNYRDSTSYGSELVDTLDTISSREIDDTSDLHSNRKISSSSIEKLSTIDSRSELSLSPKHNKLLHKSKNVPLSNANNTLRIHGKDPSAPMSPILIKHEESPLSASDKSVSKNNTV